MTEVEEGSAKTSLVQRAQKNLPQAIEPRLIALNPTLELVAVATTEKQLDVFRFGGQRAFGARSPRDKPNVDAICWKYDGSELAVWWSDNTWQSIDPATGSVGPLMAFFCEDEPHTRKIDCTIWEEKIIDPSIRSRIAAASKRTQEHASSNLRVNKITGFDEKYDDVEPDIENLLSSDSSEGSWGPKIDHLPTLLAAFNIRDELPRLSALPHVSNHDLDPHSENIINVFTRQELVDRFVNFVGSGISKAMDFLIVGYKGAHLSIAQGTKKFGLCCLNVPDAIHKQKDYNIVGFASHPSACCQAVLTSAATTDADALFSNSSFGVLFTSLNVVEESGQYVPLVTHAVAQLMILDRYIAFSIAAIREAWTSAHEVFSRYIQSIEETLAEKDSNDPKSMDLVTALYRLAVTGHCNPAVKEWMKDIMGLKGIERWSTVLPSGIVQVINLIHGNLLPALDRASIEASRLRAMSRNAKSPICRLDVKNLTQLLDDLDIMRVLSNSALLYARQEIPQIEAFATFMRCQIQMMKEPDSSAAKEAIETIAGLDYGLLLSFITGPLTRSHLNVFLGREASVIQNAPRRPKQQAAKKIILSMLERHSQNPMQITSPVVEFVNLLYQSWFISDTVRGIHRQMIAQFAGASVNAHQIPLDWDKMSDATDIRMVFKQPPFHDKRGVPLPMQEDGSMATYVVGVPENNRGQLRVHRKIHRSALLDTNISPEEIEASQRMFCTHCIAMILECTIFEVKFVSDETLVLLLSNKDDKHFLVQFPAFRFWEISNLVPGTLSKSSGENRTAPSAKAPPPHQFTHEDSKHPAEFRTAQVNFADLEPYIIHQFDSETNPGAFRPRHMHIRGPGRAAKHLLLLDEARTKYTVFDLAGIEWQWC